MRAGVAGLLCAAANSPLAWRNGMDFRRFALAEFDKFKKLVIENGLQER